MMEPQRVLIIDIDGLRQDVFHDALSAGQIPTLAGLLVSTDKKLDSACHLNPASTFPSITFCAQTTIFTGSHPGKHGIVGNQFFDRFGLTAAGKPRFYAFDVGDSLAFDDAVLTFTSSPQMRYGLVGQALNPQIPTLYEIASRNNKRSAVIYHMVSRGADTWIRPDLFDMARFTKGGEFFGVTAEEFDREMIDKTISYLENGGTPDVLTVYFMGLDHVSHHEGPGAQGDYLSRVIDPLLGKLMVALKQIGFLQQALVVIVSDHGQSEVVPDDHHSLRLSYPFDREMGYLFDALGLDVNDKPREGPATNAVVAANGGMAHIYLRDPNRSWSNPPNFNGNVMRVARAFWEAHETGKYAVELKNSLALVLVRDVQHEGWQADYHALLPSGALAEVSGWLDLHPEFQMVNGAERIAQLVGPVSGDILLVSNYRDKFYFSGLTVGVHGGLNSEDSLAVASFGLPGASVDQMAFLLDAIHSVSTRDGSNTSTHAHLSDVLPIICAVMGWKQ